MGKSKRKKQNINKNSYMSNKKVGFDLFFRKQVVINPKYDIWIELSIRSNVFYKMLVLKKDLYYPSKEINIDLDEFMLAG